MHNIVLASDATPTDRWLNVWCIWHTKVETLQEFHKSSSDLLNYTGFPGDVCVAFFNVVPGNKEAVMPNPLTKESRRVYNCDDERLLGSTKRWISKVCEIFKVCGIESLNTSESFTLSDVSVLYCGDIYMPRNVTLNETNCDWLFDMSVKRHHGRALANESCHGFQTFSRQSEGLATRDYTQYDWLGFGGHFLITSESVLLFFPPKK